MGRLLDAVDEVKSRTGGVRSLVDQWLDTLSDEDRDDALVVLRDPQRFGHAYVSELIHRIHGVRHPACNVLAWRKRNLGQAR